MCFTADVSLDARAAGLTPEYGLYSSCIGAFVYSIFSTSKDVSIGPVVSASLEVATIIKSVKSGPLGTKYEDHVIASAIGFLVGLLIFGIGLLRLGWIVSEHASSNNPLIQTLP